jgi:hypothetical protein
LKVNPSKSWDKKSNHTWSTGCTITFISRLIIVHDRSPAGDPAKEVQPMVHNQQRSKTPHGVNPIQFLLLQIFILGLIWLTVRTQMVWFWSAMSFVPPLVIVFKSTSKKVILLSLLLLFMSQHLIYPLSQPEYGFSYGSDSIHDYHVASVLYDQPHFDFGHIGYAQRSEDYSTYPMVHLFAVMTATITTVSLFNVCRVVIPLVCATLSCYCFFMVASLVFDSSLRTSGFATIVYGSLFYLTFKHGQFVRETFAFPFAFLSLLYFIKMQKEHVKTNRLRYFALFVVFSLVTFLGHHFTSYMLVIVVVLLLVCKLPGRQSFPFSKEQGAVILVCAVFLGLIVVYWRSDYFVVHLRATLIYVHNAFSSLVEGENPLQVEVMEGYFVWRTMTAVGYFAVVLFFSLAGWITILKKEPSGKKIFFTFFVLLFFISLLLRVYSPVHSSSWGYSLAKRGTVWSFIGLSYLTVKGAATLQNRVHLKPPMVAILVLWLGFSAFAPYPLLVTDSAVEPPITYQRYVSCIWLKDSSIHGHHLLIPSRTYDSEYFEIARNMAPYAYLREYNLTWARFEKFSGYIPVLPDRQLAESITLEGLDTLYDNGKVKILVK